MLKLFEHPLSPYAQRLKIALREKGIPFEPASPGEIGADAYLKLNPRGEVPTLQLENGEALTETSVILEYIEETYPQNPLLPASPLERAQHRRIAVIMATEFEAITWALGEIEYFRRAEGEMETTLRAAAERQLAGMFQWLERELAGKPWFNGDTFGYADLCIIPHINACAFFDLPSAPGTMLRLWADLCNQRDSVAATKEEARATLDGMRQLYKLIESGQMKRQYRDHRLE